MEVRLALVLSIVTGKAFERGVGPNHEDTEAVYMFFIGKPSTQHAISRSMVRDRMVEQYPDLGSVVPPTKWTPATVKRFLAKQRKHFGDPVRFMRPT